MTVAAGGERTQQRSHTVDRASRAAHAALAARSDVWGMRQRTHSPAPPHSRPPSQPPPLSSWARPELPPASACAGGAFGRASGRRRRGPRRRPPFQAAEGAAGRRTATTGALDGEVDGSIPLKTTCGGGGRAHGPTVNRDPWLGGGEHVDAKYQGKLWSETRGGGARNRNSNRLQPNQDRSWTSAMNGPIFLLPPVIGLHPPQAWFAFQPRPAMATHSSLRGVTCK